MPMNNWHAEIEVACEFWSDRMLEALDKAYPEGDLMRPSFKRLSHPANMLAFREALFAEIEAHYLKNGVEWNPGIPLAGSTMRRIRVEGRFVTPVVYHAAMACCIEGDAPFLPDGCETSINPGKVVCYFDRVSSKTIKVDPMPIDDVMRSTGDGL